MTIWESLSEEHLIKYLRKDTFIYKQIVLLLEQVIRKEDLLHEYGCGTGALVDFLTNMKYKQYVGFDKTEKVVRIGRKLYSYNKKVSFEYGDILSDNLGKADILIVKDLFEHLKDYRLALNNILSSINRYCILAFFNIYDGESDIINDLGKDYYFNMYSTKCIENHINDKKAKIIIKKSFPELKKIAKESLKNSQGGIYNYQNGFPCLYLIKK